MLDEIFEIVLLVLLALSCAGMLGAMYMYVLTV